VYRSRKEVNHPLGGGKLDNFEKLIRDAIALLIKRGEIKIPGKKRRSSPASGKT
jgi:hypothetical protein